MQKLLIRTLVVGIAVAAGSLVAGSAQPAHAQNGFYPFIIVRPADRATLKSTPIHLRPYRPLHIYGNAVRRSYHRSTARPLLNRRITPGRGR